MPKHPNTPRVWDSPSDVWPLAPNQVHVQIKWNYVTRVESLKFREWEHAVVEKVDQLFRHTIRGSISQCLVFLPGNLQCFLTRHLYGHSRRWGRPIWDDSWVILQVLCSFSRLRARHRSGAG